MALEGFKLMIGTFIVLYGATAAVGIILFGVRALDVGQGGGIESAADMFSQKEYWLALALGWAGTALLAEGTGIANSIANSSLTNTSAGIMMAGIAGSAHGLAKAGLGFGKRRAAGIGGIGAALVSPDAHQAVRQSGSTETAIADGIARYRQPGVDRRP